MQSQLEHFYVQEVSRCSPLPLLCRITEQICIASCTKCHQLDHMNSMQSPIHVPLVYTSSISRLRYLPLVHSPFPSRLFFLLHRCYSVLYRGITNYYELTLSFEFCADAVGTFFPSLYSASFLSSFRADRPIIAHTPPRGESD